VSCGYTWAYGRPRHLVHLVHHLQPSGRARCAEATLGREHPLARAEERLGWLRRQALVVAVTLVGSAIGLVAGIEQLGAALPAAALVLVVLATWIVVAVGAIRERALELIAEGRDALPLAAVRRECARLASPRRVLDLARSLDELRREARRPRRSLVAPLYVPAVIRESDAEIARLAGLLRSGRTEPAALARIERLLSGARSPLYGADGRRLREELRRIHFALG
jgi:hypothetical protein